MPLLCSMVQRSDSTGILIPDIDITTGFYFGFDPLQVT